MSDALDNDTSFWENLKRRTDNVRQAAQPEPTLYGYDDYDVSHVMETFLGEGAGALGDVAALPFEMLGLGIPDFVEEWANNKIQGIANSEAGKATAKWAQDNPKDWQSVKNVMNIMTFGKGASMLNQAVKDNKGAWASGQRNYINNHYNPDSSPASPFENTLGKAALAIKGGKPTPSNISGAGKKAKGQLEWLGSGVRGVLDSVFNPYARALYSQQGISRQGQRIVEDLINDPNVSARDKEKALSQIIYNRHIGVQSDRKGEVGQPLLDVEDFSNVQGYRDLSLDAFKEGVKKTKFKTTDGKRQYTSPKDTETAYNHILKAWDISPNRKTKIVFKEPSGGTSGNHFSDMAFKNPVNKVIRKVISSSDKRLTTDKMYKELLKLSEKKNSGFSVLSESSEDVRKNGLWVMSSFVGDSIVEGGVNAIYKVLPNGRVTAFMSDVHNFLEKAPVVGKQIEKALPTDVLAVSGAMHLDLMNNKWGQRAADKQGKDFKNKPKASPEKRKDRKTSDEILKAYVSAKPEGSIEGFKPLAGIGLMASSPPEGQEE
jgi:hypothetical protein